jgi:hypothetical protein
LLEIHFFATVISVWLERKGIPVLHASAVLANQRAIAFLASSTCGKSSLAAAWVQAGYPLLTDDILPMRENNGRFLGFPGHPQIRLWPDLAQHFLGQVENLERVHPLMDKRCIPVGEGSFGNYCGQPLPIACFYLPERQGYRNHPDIEITPLSPRDSVIELVRHSFASRSVEALGYQPRRLEFFAHLARQVPMRRLVYPSGYEHLPAVLQAVLDDLARL